MPILTRGRHRLPHQSQVLQRDLHAEKITAHLGESCFAYRQSTEQLMEAQAEGRHVYEFLVRSPESAALSFTAFDTKDQLDAWCGAYGAALSHHPQPGDRFDVALPSSVDDFEPLMRDALPFPVSHVDIMVVLPFTTTKSWRSSVEADALTIAEGWVGPAAPQVTLAAHCTDNIRSFAVRHLTHRDGRTEDSGWRVWIDSEFRGAAVPRPFTKEHTP